MAAKIYKLIWDLSNLILVTSVDQTIVGGKDCKWNLD
jgi:hypothetical protein